MEQNTCVQRPTTFFQDYTISKMKIMETLNFEFKVKKMSSNCVPHSVNNLSQGLELYFHLSREFCYEYYVSSTPAPLFCYLPNIYSKKTRACHKWSKLLSIGFNEKMSSTNLNQFRSYSTI